MEVIFEVTRNFFAILKTLCLTKMDFYRELNPLDRIYTVYHTTLFCFMAQNGMGVFDIVPRSLDSLGLYFVVFLFVYGFITLFSVICYAEMAALLPSTGAAYHYCYYSMGEFIAFLTGWNLIYGQVLHCFIKCAHLRYFLDATLFNKWIENNLSLPHYDIFNTLHFGGTVDIIYPVIVLSVAALSTALVKKGKYILTVIASIYIAITVFFMVLFVYYTDTENLTKKERHSTAFAATCFVRAAYCFSGYEVISILGEEAIEPAETIPKSVLTSMKWTLVIVIIWGVEISMVWSGLIADSSWPFRAIVTSMNLGGLQWLAFVGFLLGTWCSIYASFFLLIRVLYAMSRDGLLFNVFSKIDRQTATPFIPALIVTTILTVLGIIIKDDDKIFHSAFFSLMGTKIIIYICLLCTRYECRGYDEFDGIGDKEDRWVLLNWPRPKKEPTPVTYRISLVLIYITVASAYLLIQSMMTMRIHDLDYSWIKATSVFAFLVLVLSVSLLSRQPQNDRSYLKYTAPNVPVVPVIGMLADYTLCYNEAMRPYQWLPLVLWWVIGIIFYLSFSFRNSVERRRLYPDGTKWEIMIKDTDDFGAVSSRRQSDAVSIRSSTASESSSVGGSPWGGTSLGRKPSSWSTHRQLQQTQDNVDKDDLQKKVKSKGNVLRDDDNDIHTISSGSTKENVLENQESSSHTSDEEDNVVPNA